MIENKKIALVHHWLIGMRGGEKVVESLCRIFPDLDIYTLIYNKEKISDLINSKRIYTSFIQKMPFSKKKHQVYLPFMPVALEQFDLSGYDIVISIESGIAKGVLTKPHTCHICYCNTPMRYLWNMYFDYLNNEKMGSLKKNFIRWYFNYLRIWDLASASRVDYFISNSNNVKKRVLKYYNRESEVIYPPVNVEGFKFSGKKDGFYLAVSQLVSYKRIDLAVDAFNILGKELVIIGDGSERKSLEKRANKNIRFLGWQSDDVLKDYYSGAKAFIFPGEEDFGITPVEAQASGTPVIGYGRGGLLETVIDGATGIFFKEQNAGSLIEAVQEFEKMENSFDRNKMLENARKFDTCIFESNIKNFIMQKYNEYCLKYEL
ncbi:MAG: glycosyltransferase [Actinobacteria bacterium]|nr:glycosyltransferase [Actinomycetota bacterium]